MVSSLKCQHNSLGVTSLAAFIRGSLSFDRLQDSLNLVTNISEMRGREIRHRKKKYHLLMQLEFMGSGGNAPSASRLLVPTAVCAML